MKIRRLWRVTSIKKALATKAPRQKVPKAFFGAASCPGGFVAGQSRSLIDQLLAQYSKSIVLFFLNSALLSSPLGWDAPASNKQHSRENEIA